MKSTVSIFWFRRDLRLHDNAALYAALKSSTPVLPIFIFDTNILTKLSEDDARVHLIHQSLHSLQKALKEKADSTIALFHGNPIDIFTKILETYAVTAVYTNNDYEPYARQRDKAVKNLLNNHKIPFFIYKDQVIFEKDEVTKDDGTPYVVYTPYAKKWLSVFDYNSIPVYNNQSLLHNFIRDTDLPNLSLKDIGFLPARLKVHDYQLHEHRIERYGSTRDYPGLDDTTKLGPHLRFGTVSIREIVIQASQHRDITFLKELIWREFFMQILWHFPHTATSSFKPRYDKIQWRNDPEEFERWCQGKTGYPLVDAGMRQLNETGFMHNRIRMLTGSFLCKHLLIDWRWGEAYFAEKLLDYEMASNVGNWQWVAGCGVDAAPYFRIFNPTTQIKKFDKDFTYIHTWIKDLDEFSYPEKIVDHQFARERCLKVYKEAIQ